MLMFWSKMWVLTPQLEKSLEGFHHRAEWRMAGTVPKIEQDGKWVYLTNGPVLEILGLEEIGVYIDNPQNKFAQYIAHDPIV